ncbi:MAG TPA: MBL fold metallo-hydrolase [Solirubrobacteraceae bacterium]|jgi:glyoxylase-like metal-dependent hydrolase (beta-lactamase superfamily II)
MRAVSLHPDVLLVTSALLHLNCLVVRGTNDDEEAGAADGGTPVAVTQHGPGVAPGSARSGGGGETFVIDSPVLPDELDALPALVAQARFPEVSGLLATHADWDHLLARIAFPSLALGCAESSARRLAAEPGAAQRVLREFDEELYIERRTPLALGSLQGLPVPGHLEIGARQLDLHPTGGHTPDGMAIHIGWAGVLAVGDYLSPIEIPMLNEGGSVAEYEATLATLEPLLLDDEDDSRCIQHVVPGHGPEIDVRRARVVLEEDRTYLAALVADGERAALPAGRQGREQRRLHAENVKRLAAA